MPELSNKGFLERYGKWALVAGAAEGIGAAFAEALAKKGINLAMVDIKPDKLAELSSKLEEKYFITTKQIIKDLSEPDAAAVCMDLIKDIDCRLLVYTPAYSKVKEFLRNSSDELDKYIDLNSRTPIHLVHSFIKSLKDRKPAGIILMSSLAGMIGPPFSAPYAATKAFNIVMAESLCSEFRQKGIDITVCCAGQTSTPTYWSSNPSSTGNWPGVMYPIDVAGYALKNLGRKTICIPGWKNRLSYFLLTRFFPRETAAGLIGNSMKGIYRIK
jgi:short-subunit dehydrogenase